MEKLFQTYTKKFHKLSLEELHDIFVLRQKIFVVEQECAYLDADGLDEKAIHIFYKDERKGICVYSRLIPPGFQYKEFTAIGRVAVSLEYRNKGLARKIMIDSIKLCKKLFPNNEIIISAQCYLQKFYESLDFQVQGPSYLEDGIPHIAMTLAPVI